MFFFAAITHSCHV